MKYILICLLALIVNAANAQQAYQTFAADTINGDTAITAATAQAKYNGFVTFDFSIKGKASNDTVFVYFEGSNNNGTTWYRLDTVRHIQSGSAYTNYQVSDNPAKYLNYRLYKAAYEVSDTAYIKNKLFIYKR